MANEWFDDNTTGNTGGNDIFGDSTTGESGTSDWGVGDDMWGNTSGGSTPTRRGGYGKGGWHVLLTVLALVLTAGAAFLMAFLTKDMDQRSAVVLGLTFALPAAAVMGAALLSEGMTSAMTPSFSRKGQAGVALATIVACFVVGCFGEVTSGFVKPEPTPTPTPVVTPSPTPTVAPTPEVVQIKRNYVLLLDKSGSMDTTNAGVVRDSAAQKAVNALMEQIPDGYHVGLIMFTHEEYPYGTVINMEQNSARHRNAVASAITIKTAGATQFDYAIDFAFDLLNKAKAQGKLEPKSETHFVMLTDADNNGVNYSASAVALTQQKMKSNNVVFSYVTIANSRATYLDELVSATGGMCIRSSNLSSLTRDLITVSRVNVTPVPTRVPTPTPTIVPTPTPEPIVVKDVVRTTSREGFVTKETSAVVISAVMLVIEGLILGVALSLMLSRQGQKRFQLILSPLCGVLAAVVLGAGILPVADYMREAIAFSLYGFVFMKKNK